MKRETTFGSSQPGPAQHLYPPKVTYRVRPYYRRRLKNGETRVYFKDAGTGAKTGWVTFRWKEDADRWASGQNYLMEFTDQ